ncbi:hypothetical protein CDL15_Pgr000680 [Punica granatum]|nr:hypothetical protein CDL15_Pgr000680 [Punica granatum]
MHNEQKSPPSSSGEKQLNFEEANDMLNAREENENGKNSSLIYSTPKAQKYRIPKLLACPPAPMKRRVSLNCFPRKTPVTYFAPPDIDLFFLLAYRNIPSGQHQ